MASDNVVDFPGRDFQTWLSWAECELSILGNDFFRSNYNWQTAFGRGLRPEQAAQEAARDLETVSGA